MISKGDIDRLGNKIRDEQDNLSEETLNKLQLYRTSHKDVLSQVFTMLCFNAKKIHATAIVTYRIKRFQSIIGKLQRYPEMRFNRMWDIAGCRCIMRNDFDVYRLKDLIIKDASFEIVKEYDYLKEPQPDGYKSLHLFLKSTTNDKVVEVQLRSQVDHNWATLVEITDVLYDSKLKELGNNKELLRFHYLLSKINTLNIKEKEEIAKIIKKYNYFEKLSEVFSRNYIKVRRQWFDIENQPNHKYFLIETTKDDVPKISSFKSSNEAEEHYFNVYKSKQNANMVLTHLQKPNYNQISIAYSNYILTFHTFLTDCSEILESLTVEALTNRKYREYFIIHKLYHGLLFDHIKNLVTEIQEIERYSEETKLINKKGSKKKEQEWIADIQKQVEKSNERRKRLTNKIRNSLPKTRLGRLTVKYITLYISNKYKRKTNKLVESITSTKK